MLNIACKCVYLMLLMILISIIFIGPAWSDEDKPHIVFLTGEDPSNYEAHETVPVYATWLQETEGFQVTVLTGEGPLNAHHFPNMDVVAEADLLVIFFRRRAFSGDQMNLIKSHLKAGKPLVGIRTANHAFSVHDLHENENLNGFEAWWEFVPEILGCENRGYAPQEPGTLVMPAPDETDHPILNGVTPLEWHSEGNLYLVAPLLDEEAWILLLGKSEHRIEPIAWTRRTADGSPVFYTSLGYPSDFDEPQFRRLLANGIRWCLSTTRDE